DRDFDTRDQARLVVREYLRWYNTHRRHSTLGHLSPARFEAFTSPAHLAA
ncbi:MAG: IS3 family transposase, partial [Planctomycetes bacterium]|nr:IS3 family transposase [Planctomycetota bacterium]